MRNLSFHTESYSFMNYAEMNEEEQRIIWELRNHPSVARWMVNSGTIEYDIHLSFINKLKTQTDKDYFIIKDKDNNIIGSINIDYTETPYPERGIFINPDFFHKNHAYNSMKEFYRHAHFNWGIKGIFTKVKIDNVGSNRLEEKLGASLTRTQSGYNFYYKVF